MIRDADSVPNYVAKYASKPMDPSVTEHDDYLAQVMVHLKGKRLCSTIGSWRKLDLEAKPPDGDAPDDWTDVCSFAHLARACCKREEWALTIWKDLRAGEVPEEDLFDTS